jgi:hypothetical protein
VAAPRLVVELTIGEEDMTKLMAIARSRTETASRVHDAFAQLAGRFANRSEICLEDCC